MSARKKNINTSLFPSFIPAQHKYIGGRHFIEFHQTNPETGRRERHRMTYDLNRLKDEREIEHWAAVYVNYINSRLERGYPYVNDLDDGVMSVEKGFEVVLDVKRREITNNKSYSSYPMMVDELKAYCNEQGILTLPVTTFTSMHAVRFMDWVIVKKSLSGKTRNNYIIILKSIFYVLVRRGYMGKNPFDSFKKYMEDHRHRREFDDYERRMVASYIYATDKMLFLGIALEFYCFLRPKDIRNLRFGHIDLKKRLILTKAETSKNRRDQYVTIPEFLYHFLLEWPEMTKYPPYYYVFGAGGEPGTTKAGEHFLSYRHQAVLQQMQKRGILDDIAGLTLYSWKYSGNQALFDMNVNLMDIKNQNRHHSITVTQIYAERYQPVSEAIKRLDHNIME